MASRDFLKHVVSTSEPVGSTLGDEYYNPSSNKLYKRQAVNGTSVQWVERQQALTIQSNGTTVSTGSTIINFASSTIVVDPVTGVLRVTMNVSPAGSDTHVQFNSGGALTGSSNFTWNNSSQTLALTGFLTTFALSRSGNINAPTWTTASPIFNSAAALITDTTGSGTIALKVGHSLLSPNFASSAVTTITDAANLYVNAAVASTNTTITNNWSLYVAGNQRITGTLYSDSNIQLSGSRVIDYKNTTAQWTMSGGGLVTWTGTSLLWNQRVIVIPVANPTMGSSGYFDITCPTSGNITYYNSVNVTTTVTATAAGIPLGSWEALYYIATEGMGSGSDPTKFAVVNYQNSTWRPSTGWILLAAVNGDGTNIGHVKWLPGQVNLPSTGATVTYNTGTGAASWYGTGSGSVTSVSVTSANGFAGTVATATSTPAITISTSITGVLKGNGTAISAATAGTDYSAGTSALATGILKSTTSTGALTIASSSTDYQLPIGTISGMVKGNGANALTAATAGTDYDSTTKVTQDVATATDFNLTFVNGTTGQLGITVGTTTTGFVYKPSTGNVGIGAASTAGNRLIVGGGTITVGTNTTYAFSAGNTAAGDFTIGSDATYIYLQSWNSKPINLNSQGNNVVTSSASTNLVMNNGTTSRQRITIGSTTSASTATPEAIDLGGTYSSAAGANLKLKLWNDATNTMGLGISSNQLDYVVTNASYNHVWYQGGAEAMRIDANRYLGVGISSSIAAKVDVVSPTPATINAIRAKSNIGWLSPAGTSAITSKMLDAGTLSFEGTVGQLFSITNSMTGTIFSVNDISGIPSIEVLDTGVVKLAQYGGFVAYGVSSALTAAGSTQGTALALTRPINDVTTVAASTGVVLPAATAGMRIVIRNGGANTMNVYPASGAQINTLGTNVAFAHSVSTVLEFVAFSTTQWYTINTTYA